MKKYVSFFILLTVAMFFVANNVRAEDTENTVACTADVKQCPDGSFVSRHAPSCEFAKCPGEEADGRLLPLPASKVKLEARTAITAQQLKARADVQAEVKANREAMQKELEAKRAETQTTRENIQKEIQANRDEANAEIKAKREEMQKQIQDKRVEVKAEIEVKRTAAKEKMEALKAQVKTEKDAAKAKIKEARIAGREEALKKFDGVIERMTSLKDKVNAQITKFQAKGVPVEAAQAFTVTAEAKLGEAQIKIAQINVLLSVSIEEITPDQKVILKGLVENVQTLINDARDALDSAAKALREAVILKMQAEASAKAGNTSATSTTTVNTQ